MIDIIKLSDGYVCMGYYSKDHLDKTEFAQSIKEEYEETIDPEKIEYTYARNVPNKDAPEQFYFVTTSKSGPGAFKCTYYQK